MTQTTTQTTNTTKRLINATLMRHQAEGVRRALARFAAGRVGYGFRFEMGCGKTLTALATAAELYDAGKIKRVLVLCPASIVSVWQKDTAQFLAVEHSVGALVGTKPQRLRALYELSSAPGLQIAVCNYEGSRTTGVDVALEDFRADLIICDESQRIKTHNSAQSKVAHRLGDAARYRIILTGTPITNDVSDVWSQWRFLDPNIFGRSFWAYRSRYCLLGGFEGRQVIGVRNADELQRKIDEASMCVSTEECLDLPDQNFIDQPVALEAKARKVYDALRRDAVAELEAGDAVTADTVLTKLLRLQQLCGGFLTSDEGVVSQVSTAKLDALSDIIDAKLAEGGKVVVFAIFKAELAAIRELLEKKGIGYGYIAGEVAIAERGAIVDRFQRDDDCRVFVAQTTAAGLGLTLTAADLTVFYSFGYNFADYSQACARTHRIGQTRKCTYIHLVTEQTVDARILQAIRRKEKLAASFVSAWRDII